MTIARISTSLGGWGTSAAALLIASVCSLQIALASETSSSELSVASAVVASLDSSSSPAGREAADGEESGDHRDHD